MRAALDAINFKRIYKELTLNVFAYTWIIAAALLIFVMELDSKPPYFVLVLPGCIASVFVATDAMEANSHYDNIKARKVTVKIIITLAALIGGFKYAIGEMFDCRDLYDDEEMISIAQKAYSDMSRAGTTQVSIHALQSLISSKTISAHDQYMCLGIVYKNSAMLVFHQVVLILFCVVAILCGVIVSAMLTFQDSSMKAFMVKVKEMYSHLHEKTHEKKS